MQEMNIGLESDLSPYDLNSYISMNEDEQGTLTSSPSTHVDCDARQSSAVLNVSGLLEHACLGTRRAWWGPLVVFTSDRFRSGTEQRSVETVPP